MRVSLRWIDEFVDLPTEDPVVLTTVLNNLGLEVDLERGLSIESLEFGSLATTEDYQEGTSAFLEKREPVFKGK